MSPPRQALRDLPIREVVSEVYATLARSYVHLPRALFLPVVFATLLAVAGSLGLRTAYIGYALWLADFVPVTMFCVAWHRLVLLGPSVAAPRPLLGWKGRHWRFCGYLLLMAFLTQIILTFGAMPIFVLADQPPLSIVTGDWSVINKDEQGRLTMNWGLNAGLLLLWLLIATALLRLYFVFPATAVQERYGLSDAWRHTKGQTLRLFLGSGLSVVPIAVVGWLIVNVVLNFIPTEAQNSAVADAQASAIQWFMALFLFVLLRYLILAFLVTFVSIAFRVSTGWVPYGALPDTRSNHDGPNSGTSSEPN